MTKPTGNPRGRPPLAKPTFTNDGAYQNAVMGLGGRRDPGAYTSANAAKMLSEGELTDLYIGDGFARRVIDVPAHDMVRAGFCIEVEGETDEDIYKPVMARLEVLDALKRLSESVKLAWLYGGSLIVLGVKDGGELIDPVNDNSVEDVEFLRVYDRHRVSRMTRYDDPADSRYGETKTYLVSPINGSPYEVHHSRCIVMMGEFLPEQQRELQDGWGGSKLAQCYHQLVRLGTSYQWTEKLLERSQQAVNKMAGLGQTLSSPGGEKAVMNRLNVLDMSRNILNTVAIDSQDDYTITTSSLAGVPDVLDRMAQSLSAVAGMPKTLLMGEQSKGMNNSGEGDLQNWHSQVSQWQNDILKNPIDRLVTMLATANGIPDQDYMIEFNPLYVPSEKEKAEVEKLEAESEKIKAETASIYVTAGALDPSELRETLIEEGDYIMDGTIKIMQNEDDGIEA